MSNQRIVKGTPLAYNVGTMQTFSAAINKVVNPMVESTDALITKAFEDYREGRLSSRALAVQLPHNLEEEENLWILIFLGAANNLFPSYISAIDKQSSMGVARNLQALYNQRGLNEDKKEEETIEDSSRNEFLNFMKGIVVFYFLKNKKKVAQYVMSDNSSTLKAYLSSQRRITRKRAKLELQDNYRETFNALNRVKMEANDIHKFLWEYTYRSKTERPYHVNVLRNQIYDVRNPPIINPKTRERGFPGQEPNCKCRMQPVALLK